jgi:hypothetical protein
MITPSDLESVMSALAALFGAAWLRNMVVALVELFKKSPPEKTLLVSIYYR